MKKIIFLCLLSTPIFTQKNIKGFSFIEKDLMEESYYIKNNEVTIGEYLEFVDWVIDSSARRYLAMNDFEDDFILKESFNDVLERVENYEIKPLNYKAKLSWDNDEYLSLLIERFYFLERQSRFLSGSIDARKVVYRTSKDEVIRILPENYVYYYGKNDKSLSYVFLNKTSPKEKLQRRGTYRRDGSKYLYESSRSIDDRLFIRNISMDLPVVSVSYEQANAYCIWKTKQLNIKSKKQIYSCELPSLDHYKRISEVNENGIAVLLIKPFQLESATEDINIDLIFRESYYLHAYQDSMYKYKNQTRTHFYKRGDNLIDYETTGVLDGVYRSPEYNNIDLHQLHTQRFYNRFVNTRDYYSYSKKNKELLGVIDNVSEWTVSDTNTLKLEKTRLDYKNITIKELEINQGKYIYGGNWFNGTSNNIKYIEDKEHLETIGFRYIVNVTNK